MDILKDVKPWTAAQIADIHKRFRVKDGDAIDRHRLNHVLAEWGETAFEVLQQYWYHENLLRMEKLSFAAWDEAKHVEVRKGLLEGGEKPSHLTQKIILGAMRVEPKLSLELKEREERLANAEVVAGFFQDLMRIFRDSRDTIGNLSHNLRAEYQHSHTDHDTQERHDDTQKAASDVRRRMGASRRSQK